jgi:hypothetical protein
MSGQTIPGSSTRSSCGLLSRQVEPASDTATGPGAVLLVTSFLGFFQQVDSWRARGTLARIAVPARRLPESGQVNGHLPFQSTAQDLDKPKNLDSKKGEMTRARTDISLGNLLRLLMPHSRLLYCRAVSSDRGVASQIMTFFPHNLNEANRLPSELKATPELSRSLN